MPVAGNPQINIRLEQDAYRAVCGLASSQGIKPSEWIRRLIKQELGLVPSVAVPSSATESIPLTDLHNVVEVAVTAETNSLRNEIQTLASEVANLKKL